MVRKVIFLSLMVFVAAPVVFADPPRALRDIALTSIAVQKNRSASSRRAVLDQAFDASGIDLRDSLNDTSVRGKKGSQRLRNWFANGDWYTPQPRRPYGMPELSMVEQNRGVMSKMGSSFQTALTPWRQLLNAASKGSWSSVAIVRDLAG